MCYRYVLTMKGKIKMAQYELWCFDLNDCSTYQWLGYGTDRGALADKCRELFSTRKYDKAMLCVVERNENSADWKVVHPVIFNDNPTQSSKHPTEDDKVGFVWKSQDGDPSHEAFNNKLKEELEKSKIERSKKS